MNSTPLTEFRDRVSEIVDSLQDAGGEWIITRHGRAVAVVLSVDDYESLVETVNILSDAETMEAIDEGLADDSGASSR